MKKIILSITCLAITSALYAADAELKLNSNDGTTQFEVQDSNSSPVATIDSDGNMVLESSATIKKAMRAAKYLTEAHNTGATLTTLDFGKTITVASASAQIVYLPSVDVSNKGAWFRIIKLGPGKVTIAAADSDTIADSGTGGTIYNGATSEDFATITLQLGSDTGWFIAGGCGTWITTD